MIIIKKILLLLLLLVLLPIQALASSIVSDPNGNVSSFNWNGESYTILFAKSNVKSVTTTYYSDSSFSSVTGSSDYTASTYMQGVTLVCERYAQYDLFDSSGGSLGSIQVETFGGSCPEATPPPPTENVYDDILNQINNSLGSNGQVLRDILNEMKPSIEIGDSSPIQQGSLTVPDQPQTAFQDDTTYFTDSGDASEPLELPKASEPKDWGFPRDNPETKDPSQTKDPTNTKDPVGEKDPTNTKDPVVSKDPTETKDPVGSKDPVAEKDAVGSKDPVATKDPVGSKDPVALKDPTGTKDAPGTKDPVATKDPTGSKDPVGSQDPVTTKDPTNTKDPVGSKDPVNVRDPVMVQDPIVSSPPRWSN